MNHPSVNPKTGYIVGATLPPEATTYVTRQADADFYEGLKRGDFCYVLNARQMGKSSLQVRTRRRLEAEGVACALIDIGLIGSTSTGEQWYAGIIRILVNELGLKDNFDLKTWWQDNSLLSPLQRLSVFIGDILLTRISQPIVIFVDESDGIRRFGQDFFVLIRACYNQRADKPAYQRLTFGILGVASPGDLIADKTITPFNIGRGIELGGFKLAEAMPLAKGLATKSSHPEALLAIVLEWTGGQPFLTQKLCQRISLCERPLVAGEEAGWVENLVQTDFLDHWESQDEPMHLRHIRDRILHEGGPTTGRLLGMYQQILQHGAVLADDSREQLELRLSGLVVKQHQQLVVYNPIYARVFDQRWVESVLKNLRPYAETFNAWVASGKQDESRLLQGQALQEAQAWAKEKNLDKQDYEFLEAGQQLAQRLERKALQVQAQRRVLLVVVAALGVAIGLTVWAFSERQQAEQISSERIFEALVAPASLITHREDINLPNSAISSAIAPDCNSVAVGFADGSLRLYALSETHLLWEQEKVHSDKISRLAFNVEGTLLASASFDNTAKLWQVKAGKLQAQQTFTGHKATVHAVAFSPDSQILATASYDGQIGLFTVGTEKKSFIGRAHEGEKVHAVSFGSDNTKLLSASDYSIRLWNLNTVPPTLLQIFPKDHPKDQDMLMWASLSHDNQWVVSVGRDSVEIYTSFMAPNIYDERWKTLSGHEQTIYRAIFSPDSQQVATVSADATVRLWDVNSGRKLFGLRLPTNKSPPVPLWDFDFRCLPDGHCWIAVPLMRGKLVLYELEKYDYL